MDGMGVYSDLPEPDPILCILLSCPIPSVALILSS